MRGAEPEHARGILQEAFAVIESCFEMWLEEAGDEEEVLGLVFRGRDDLPGSTVRPRTGDGRPDSEPVAQPAAANGRRRPIAVQKLALLEHAAIDQHLARLDLDAISRARHLAIGA